ncbi:hypothetical protein N665_0388s0006, partial [Sinapis alba]
MVHHAPLYLQLTPEVQGNACRRPFRFEVAWLQHTEFKDLEALLRLGVKLKKWNKEVFGNVQHRKEKLVMEIKEIQEKIEEDLSDELLVKEGELLKEFEVVLEKEEVIWFQKLREKWVAHGDRNTKFFHMSTIIKRRRNRVDMLKNDANQWISDAQALEKLAVNYFKTLYSLENVDTNIKGLSMGGFVRLTNKVEIIRKMGSYKAPGPDGFQPVFYQRCWETVGPSVVRFILQFFETG